MALAIDGSTPAVVTSSSTTISTLSTASFTPPASALLLNLWAGNSHIATNPSQPSITDNLGVPLTYTLTDWQSRANSPTVDGQAAAWWANVGSSAAMTVTSTINVATDPEKQQALGTIVLTDTSTPTVGAHGKSGSTSTASIAQSYTATATGSWGFIVVCDWDALGSMTAGTGCTLIATGTIPTTQISYGLFRRTTADGSNGGTTTLNVNLAGTSTHVSWVYVEVVPAAGAGTAGNDGPPAMLAPPVISQPWRRASWLPWLASNGTDAATAQTFTQSLAGSVTPTGTLQNAVAKPGLAGSVTATGALAKQANKALAGSSTPTGVLTAVKVVLRSFAGSVTPTGSLAKQVNKALAGSSTATGTLTRQVAKALAGSVTAVGSLAKLVAKALAGPVTPTGVLTSTRVILRSFAGAVTPTGVLTRQTNKALTGSSTPRGAITRAVSKALAGAVTAVGSLAKLVAKPLAGRSTPAGSLTATPVGATQNATSTPTTLANRTSTASITASTTTSTATVAPQATSTPTTSASRTSTPTVSGPASSTSTVSDG